jgi:hypothetical protein
MNESQLPKLPRAGNLGEPIKLRELQLNGVSAEAVRTGRPMKMWTRFWTTSDDRMFHTIVEGLAGHLHHRANQAGHPVDLKKHGYVLLVIHPDNTGELWLDNAAVSLNVMVKRPVVAGSPVFESDIADVIAMSFPLVEINKEDRVVCIFREGWRFGLFFDFNPEENLSVENMERDLGTLLRTIKYRDLYEVISNQNVFDSLISAGWFPFVEIVGEEFYNLANSCKAGFDLVDQEKKIIEAFDESRIEQMFTRWLARPHFAGKEKLLRSALRNYAEGDSVAVLKIVLTEIEGILREAYRAKKGNSAKLGKLLEFAIASAESKSGSPDTLLLPTAFARYLKLNTFADFDPNTGDAKSGSRHAIGHGAAVAETYTQVRALQSLLTLDQLAFYT